MPLFLSASDLSLDTLFYNFGAARLAGPHATMAQQARATWHKVQTRSISACSVDHRFGGPPGLLWVFDTAGRTASHGIIIEIRRRSVANT